MPQFKSTCSPCMCIYWFRGAPMLACACMYILACILTHATSSNIEVLFIPQLQVPVVLHCELHMTTTPFWNFGPCQDNQQVCCISSDEEGDEGHRNCAVSPDELIRALRALQLTLGSKTIENDMHVVLFPNHHTLRQKNISKINQWDVYIVLYHSYKQSEILNGRDNFYLRRFIRSLTMWPNPSTTVNGFDRIYTHI